jgi:hypothetical protein
MALDKTDLAIAGGGALAFVLGWRRLAGVVWGVGGLYEYDKGKKIGGGIGMAAGATFALFPDWPESLVGALRSQGGNSSPKTLPAPKQIDVPAFQRVSFPSLDRALDGDWTMLDVRDIRDGGTNARAQSLKPGDMASLVLRNKNGPFTVFNAKVIGGSSSTMYNATWASGPPVGGPQMIDFSPEHIFAVN